MPPGQVNNADVVPRLLGTSLDSLHSYMAHYLPALGVRSPHCQKHMQGSECDMLRIQGGAACLGRHCRPWRGLCEQHVLEPGFGPCRRSERQPPTTTPSARTTSLWAAKLGRPSMAVTPAARVGEPPAVTRPCMSRLGSSPPQPSCPCAVWPAADMHTPLLCHRRDHWVPVSSFQRPDRMMLCVLWYRRACHPLLLAACGIPGGRGRRGIRR